MSQINKKESQSNKTKMPNNNDNINKEQKNNCVPRTQSDNEVQKTQQHASITAPLDSIVKLCESGGGDSKPTISEAGPSDTVLRAMHMDSQIQAATSNLMQEQSTMKPMRDNQTKVASGAQPGLSKSARQRRNRKEAQSNKYVAMDCEMVGVGYKGLFNMLARVSIVNKQGDVLLDKFVKPRKIVTDYRTSISGIRPRDIEEGEDFGVVKKEVIMLLEGKVLVGHAIRNDLAVLHIKHPGMNIRDTSRYMPLRRLVTNGRTPSLKRLAQAVLGIEIQMGEHNSVEDARATMSIYNQYSVSWERWIQKLQRGQ